jgi:hypothetical protein
MVNRQKYSLKSSDEAIIYDDNESMKIRTFHLLLWTTGIFSVLAVISEIRGTLMDIQFGDTYFVFSESYVFFVPALFLLVLWLLYLLLDKILYSNALRLFHILITIITLVIFVGSLFVSSDTNMPATTGIEFARWNSYFDATEYARIMQLVIYFFIFGQIIFVLNLMAGLVCRYSGRNVKVGGM